MIHERYWHLLVELMTYICCTFIVQQVDTETAVQDSYVTVPLGSVPPWVPLCPDNPSPYMRNYNIVRARVGGLLTRLSTSRKEEKSGTKVQNATH